MKKRTAREWSELVDDLTSQRDDQQGIIAGGSARRRKHALAASQGDESAAAALRKIKAADDAAREQIANLDFAIEAAQANLDAALAVEREDDDRQRAERVDKLADVLIELDVKFIAALRVVHDALCERTRTAEELVVLGADQLGRMKTAQLRNEENILDAVYDVLGPHLGGRQAPMGAASKLIAHDCFIFGKQSPVPLPPLSAAEKERRRSIANPVGPLRMI